MARTSVTHLILFIAVVGASTLFVGALTDEVGLYAQSVDREGERTAAAIGTEIQFIDDPTAGSTYDEDEETVTLYLKNVGGSTLEPTALEVLIDGEYVEAAAVRVLDDDYWRDGRVLEVTVDRPLETGDHRAMARIDGAQAILEFEHRLAYWLDPSGEPGTSESDCDAEACTVDAGQTDALALTMGTDPTQEDESVSYAVDDTTVAAVDPATGTTDAAGESGTTLDLRRNGTVSVTLETGWDNDEIVVTVVNATDSFFEVSNFTAPESTRTNETITVDATVENVGSDPDTQTLEYRFDGVVEQTTTVTLDPGESRIVEFTHTIDAGAGTYTHGIYSEEDDDTGTITVEAE